MVRFSTSKMQTIKHLSIQIDKLSIQIDKLSMQMNEWIYSGTVTRRVKDEVPQTPTDHAPINKLVLCRPGQPTNALDETVAQL